MKRMNETSLLSSRSETQKKRSKSQQQLKLYFKNLFLDNLPKTMLIEDINSK